MPQYSDIPVTPVYGPLSHQYPTIQPKQNLAVQNGRPTPPFFYPSQEPINSDQNTTARQQYLRTAKSSLGMAIDRARELSRVTRNNNFNYSTGVAKQTSGHMNYIAPMDSSLRIQKLKSNAVSKSSFKVGLPTSSEITTKNYEPSNLRTHLRRVRSGGCVAPAKKGSIFNQSLNNGRACAIGSLIRNQSYIVTVPSVVPTLIKYAVTVDRGINDWGTGNKFYINGVVSPQLTFLPGYIYRFSQSDSSNKTHPLRFSTTPNGTHAGGTEYTTGVVKYGVPGTPDAYVEINVTDKTTLPLYYYCANHPGMGDTRSNIM